MNLQRETQLGSGFPFEKGQKMKEIRFRVRLDACSAGREGMCQSRGILVRLQSMCEARKEGCSMGSMGGLVITRLNLNDLALRLANSLFVLIAGAEQGAKPRNIESSKPIKKRYNA